MENRHLDKLKAYFCNLYEPNPDVQSISFIHTANRFSPLIDGFDLLVFVVSKTSKRPHFTTHYIKEGVHIQERWINTEGIQDWILTGENRNIIQWILEGEVIFERHEYLTKLRQRLLDFPEDLREKKRFREFSLFLRTYLQAKEYAKAGHFLDAYSNLVEALHHWARIAIIENGYHPEVMVWKQVHDMDPDVYKLYEELITSNETLEQRVQLVLLACEFSVMSKMKRWCKLLLKIMATKRKPWTVAELKNHDALADLHVEVALVLKQLVKKALIKEVAGTSERKDELQYML
jgi:hypothetical protein